MKIEISIKDESGETVRTQIIELPENHRYIEIVKTNSSIGKYKDSEVIRIVR